MTPLQATCIALGHRGLLIEGPPGSGKSSLALALIDRGARLVGDDSLMVSAQDGQLYAQPHPQTRGLIEVRNLGLLALDALDRVRLCLAIRLCDDAPRFIDTPESRELLGLSLPMVRLWPGGAVLHIQAEMAMQQYALAPG